MKQTWQKKPKKTQHFLLKFYFLQKSYSIKSSLDSELSSKAEQNYKQEQDTVFLSDFTSQSFSSILEHTLCTATLSSVITHATVPSPLLGSFAQSWEGSPTNLFMFLGKSNPLLHILDHFRKQIHCSHYSNNWHNGIVI